MDGPSGVIHRQSLPLDVRLARTDDAAMVAAIYAPAVRDLATSFELDAPDAADMARRIATTLQRTPWLVCTRGDHVVGYAYGGRHRERAAYQWSVEVSAYVDDAARRAGVGRALYTSLLAILELQGFHRAFAGITLPNEASVGLHEALGFAPIGVFPAVGFKHGRWHDVGWYALGLGPARTPPGPPRPLPDVVGDDGFAAALHAGLRTLTL